MSEQLILRDPNEFLRPPEKHVLLSAKVQGSYIVVNYFGYMEDGKDSYVSIFLNDHGQEVIRTVRLVDKEPEPVALAVEPEPLSWYEKVWLYIEVYSPWRY